MTETRLAIYVVYERPRDYPDEYVIRRNWVPGGAERQLFARGPNLASVRAQLPEGLTRLDPHPSDDPVILETWL